MYKIQRENYEAAEDYLLGYNPDGFMRYNTVMDVKQAVESLLETFNRHPDSSYVSCGALLLTCDEEDCVVIHVNPAYRYREVKGYLKYPLKPEEPFELV